MEPRIDLEIKFITRGTVLVLAVCMDVWIWRKR